MEALHLISLYDVRRFRRVQKYIRYIIYRENISAGTYDKHGKVCWIDLSYFPFESDPEWYLAQYAAALVHEATHGWIDARKIP